MEATVDMSIQMSKKYSGTKCVYKWQSKSKSKCSLDCLKRFMRYLEVTLNNVLVGLGEGYP